MRILSVDSTAQTGSVAIVDNGKISALYTIEAQTHSTTLLPMIESVMKSLDLSVTDMDLLAVSNGPGSFTGIRIGVAAVKGLAFKDNIPCIGISSLEAMAHNLAGLDGIICPVINARRSQVYTALFRSEGGVITRLTEDSVALIPEMDDFLSGYDCPVYFSGDAAEAVFESVTHSSKMLPPVLLRHPSAYGVAAAAEKIFKEADDISVFTENKLSPSYLRKTQAEREREERLERGK